MLTIKSPAKCALYIGMFLFVLLKLKLFFTHNTPLWDEAVYLTMGKFLLTLGEQGMWEVLRPPLFPVILGVLQFLGDPILLGRILFLGISCASAWLLYALLKNHVDEMLAALTGLLLIFSDVYFQWSNHLLTGVLSTFFILLCLYLLKNKSYFCAGLIGAAAFLTRFPTGLILFCVLVYYVLLFFGKNKKETFFQATKFGIGAILPILGWLFINWLTWSSVTSHWAHAAFRPLLFGATNVAFHNTWLYDTTLTFYLANLLYTIPILLLGIVGLTQLKKKHTLFPLAFSGIMFFLFFTILPHNEWRFIIPALPGLLALTALGLHALVNLPLLRMRAVTVVLALAVLGSLVVTDVQQLEESTHYSKPDILPFYNFLATYSVAGPVIINDPVAAWYLPNKVIPIYFEHLPKFRLRLAEKHDAVIFTPHAFPCQQADTQCKSQLREVVDRLTTTEKLIHQTQWLGNDYYIFSTKPWYTPLQVAELRAAYGLTETVTLSPHPYDKLPVVLILEDFPSLNEDRNAIWKEKAFEETLLLFSKETVTAAVIPTHLQVLERLEPEVVEEVGQFFLAQNGYDHANLVETNQTKDIIEGKILLENIYGKDVISFIPPFYSANEETAQLLAYHGFTTYITTIGDPVQPSITRLDQTNTLILNWDQKLLKTPQQVRNDLERISRYGDYALVSVYYFMYEDRIEVLEETLEEFKQYQLVTPQTLADWLTVKHNITLNVTGNAIVVEAPEDTQGITLLFRESGDYTVQSPVPVTIKNVATETLRICLDVCDDVQPQEFFTR